MSYERSLPMAMLPNDSHPGPGCSCEACMRAHPDFAVSAHPDWNTPNWCNTCSPKGYSCCRCDIASNE